MPPASSSPAVDGAGGEAAAGDCAADPPEAAIADSGDVALCSGATAPRLADGVTGSLPPSSCPFIPPSGKIACCDAGRTVDEIDPKQARSVCD